MEALSRLVAAVAPVAGHLLERLAFGFGHQAEHKPCGEDTYHAIERVCEHVAETIAHRAEFHVIHRNECRRHYEVEYPLEGHRDGNSRAADGVGENLGDEHPAYRTPREHEACRINHDGRH